MTLSTQTVYQRVWDEFVSWLQDRWGDSAELAYFAIKSQMGLCSVPDDVKHIKNPTTPLTETEVTMSWPIIKEIDDRMYMVLRLVYVLGVEPGFILGDSQHGYDGLNVEDIIDGNGGTFVDFYVRGGGVWRYRLESDLAKELKQFVEKMKGRRFANRSTSNNLFGFSARHGRRMLGDIIKQLEMRGIIRSRLTGKFNLWRFSPRLRPYKDPVWRDHRELAS